MNQKQKEQEEARAELRKILNPGDTVYTVLRHRSASGMSRVIDFFVFRKNEPLRLTWSIGKAADYSYNRKYEGLAVGGCGMDMGFSVVYNLGRALWPNGDGKYKTGRNGMTGPETDGGYLLNQRWL